MNGSLDTKREVKSERGGRREDRGEKQSRNDLDEGEVVRSSRSDGKVEIVRIKRLGDKRE